MLTVLAEGSVVDFGLVSSVADCVVTVVGKIAGMITGNPILFLGIGLGLFYGGIKLVKGFTRM